MYPVDQNARGSRLAIALVGIAGLVVTWILFFLWGLEHDFAFFKFWDNALFYSQARGLVWDLVACGVILTIVTLKRSAELGWTRVALILLGTWILGVCVGLPLFFLLKGRGQQHRTGHSLPTAPPTKPHQHDS